MPTIIVTGAAGQLGQSLRKVAAQHAGCRIIGCDLPGIDITSEDSVENFLAGHPADVIINCAAYTAVDKAESDAGQARRINVDGPAVLAAAACRHQMRLIHISTDYVFDGNAVTPYSEDARPAPRSVYGSTKREGELAVEASGCDALVVRTAWLYSEFGRNFMKTMLQLAASRDTVRVVCDQEGSPTYATDLADALLTMACEPFKGFRTVHCTNSGHCSWADFAAAIFREAGLSVQVARIPTSEYPTPATRPAWSVLDMTQLRTVFGISTPAWQDGLHRAMAAYKALGTGA